MYSLNPFLSILWWVCTWWTFSLLARLWRKWPHFLKILFSSRRRWFSFHCRRSFTKRVKEMMMWKKNRKWLGESCMMLMMMTVLLSFGLDNFFSGFYASSLFSSSEGDLIRHSYSHKMLTPGGDRQSNSRLQFALSTFLSLFVAVNANYAILSHIAWENCENGLTLCVPKYNIQSLTPSKNGTPVRQSIVRWIHTINFSPWAENFAQLKTEPFLPLYSFYRPWTSDQSR